MLPKAYQSTSSAAIRLAVLLSLVGFVFVLTAYAQNGAAKKVSQTVEPAWHGYKGVNIGMTVKEVRDKIGDPKSEDAQGYFYMMSETETVQVLFDEAKKVRTISVVYAAEHANAPKYTDVFENGMVVEPKPDGALYKLVRYPEAGYWVSYNRTAGDKGMVIVVIQKL